MNEITPGWKHLSIGIEGAIVRIDGINPWKTEWRNKNKTIIVAHPSYPNERHTMWVYEATSEGKTIQFAAGEYSNGVWGFYVPT
ncbi:MAG: hypothetical protein LBE21_07430 [Pseudomonadales bacterium]|jgi:hypothetical protein|nr:hypothetical protein [Pseudomonadales bacterium]